MDLKHRGDDIEQQKSIRDDREDVDGFKRRLEMKRLINGRKRF